MTAVHRKDFRIPARDGINIAVREVRPEGPADRVPMVLLHGTRIPGISEFDLPVENGSLAGDLAAKGHVCYIVDARGYGRSDRPQEMEEPPVPYARSLYRSVEIIRDVEAAVDHLRTATGRHKVGLLGWGVGGTISALFATLQPEKVSHIVGYMMVYGGAGGSTRLKIGSVWDDPEHPGRFNKKAFGNYAWNSLEFLDKHWNDMIPVEDKDSWRDPAMFLAFRQALIDGDPKSTTHDPPMYRSPNGMLEDLYTMGCRGEPLFSATNIYCKVMIARGELDTLSLVPDIEAYIDDLVNAEEVVYFDHPGATHYLLLDRPQHGRTAFLERLDQFLR